MSAPRKTILIVDDDPLLLRSVARVLAHLQADVSTAENAEVALELMARCPFDLVISDLRMPGLDGVELLEAAQTRGLRKGAFVFLTGYSDRGDAELIGKGANAVYHKPIDREAMLAMARRWLEAGSSPQ